MSKNQSVKLEFPSFKERQGLTEYAVHADEQQTEVVVLDRRPLGVLEEHDRPEQMR